MIDFDAIQRRKQEREERVKKFKDKKDKLVEFYKSRFLVRGYDQRNPILFDKLTEFCACYYSCVNRKGLFLCAKEKDVNTGIGKTLGMQVIGDIFTIRLENVAKLSETYTESHDRYLEMITVPNYYRSTKKNDLIIDEVGAEPISNSYGKKLEVFIDILENRYQSYTQKGSFTHFTSNLTPKEIENRYGHRVWSRINEMCTVIEISGKDSRFE